MPIRLCYTGNNIFLFQFFSDEHNAHRTSSLRDFSKPTFNKVRKNFKKSFKELKYWSSKQHYLRKKSYIISSLIFFIL